MLRCLHDPKLVEDDSFLVVSGKKTKFGRNCGIVDGGCWMLGVLRLMELKRGISLTRSSVKASRELAPKANSN